MLGQVWRMCGWKINGVVEDCGMRLRTRMTLMQVVSVVVAIAVLCWVFIYQVSNYAEKEMGSLPPGKAGGGKAAAQGFRPDGDGNP